MVCAIILFLVLSAFSSSALGATFHVDPGGSDAWDGRTPERAWKTLHRASKAALQPGDRLLFKSGGRFTGRLVIDARGVKGFPIRVGKYGGDEYPVLAGEGEPDSTVAIRNPAYIIVEDLEVTNTLPDGGRRNGMFGVRVAADSGGEFHGVVLRGLHVHHVSGGWDRQGGAGILLSAGGDDLNTGSKRSRFIGLRIEDCCVHDVSFYGIFVTGWANRNRDSRWYPSRKLVVRDNLVYDTGGDAIVVIATQGALLEHNEAYRCSRGQQNGGRTPSGGIWPHSSDGATVRYNKVAGIRGMMDCQPYDIDINCRNTVVEFNMSEDNSGGFILLCAIVGDAGPTLGALVRNNISIGDGFESGRLITAVGLVSEITIENNVFIGHSEKTVNILGGWESKEYPWCRGISLRRNVFFTEGEFTFDPGGMRDIRVQGNAYEGRFASASDDPNGVWTNLSATDLLPANIRSLKDPALTGLGFVPFDLAKCGLTQQSRWLAERDKAAVAHPR